jgi:hypothetical protein
MALKRFYFICRGNTLNLERFKTKFTIEYNDLVGLEKEVRVLYGGEVMHVGHWWESQKERDH